VRETYCAGCGRALEGLARFILIDSAPERKVITLVFCSKRCVGVELKRQEEEKET
jgi:predicted Fe-S protein YdhL (DUF1289 family)